MLAEEQCRLLQPDAFDIIQRRNTDVFFDEAVELFVGYSALFAQQIDIQIGIRYVVFDNFCDLGKRFFVDRFGFDRLGFCFCDGLNTDFFLYFAPCFQQLFDSAEQCGRFERFCHKNVDVQFDAFVFRLIVVSGSEHDDRNRSQAGILFHSSDHVEPAHDRHHLIDKDQIGYERCGNGKSRTSVLGRKACEIVFEHIHDEPGNLQIILDDEYFGFTVIACGNALMDFRQYFVRYR